MNTLAVGLLCLIFSKTLVAHHGCGFSSVLSEDFTQLRQQHASDTAMMHARLNDDQPGQFEGLNRMTSASPQPIRFHIDYQIDNLQNMSATLLKDKIIPVSVSVLQDYIRVKNPVQGRLTLPVTCISVFLPGHECADVLHPAGRTCGLASLNPEHYGKYQTCFYDSNFAFSCETKSFGTGVENADFILYVTALDSSHCKQGTAAFAHHCETDVQSGRPLSGNINMCPSFFETSETMMQQIETVIHEILHALVFNPSLWLLFVDENGNKMSEQSVVGVVNIGSEEIHAIVSKHAVEAARDHFGCEEIQAVPLENQGSKGTIGAHWDSRYMQGELMDPVAGQRPLFNRHIMSNITLGLLEDSGWYIPGYSKAGYMSWGKDAGCDFITQDCNTYSTLHPDQAYFCSSESDLACVSDYTAIGHCSKNDQTLNGCLTIETFVNTDCLQHGNEEIQSALASHVFLESHGLESRCIGVEAPLFRSKYGFRSLELPYRCYKHFCIDGDLFLDIEGFSARCPTGEMIDLSQSFSSLGYTQGRLGPCPDNARLCLSLACPEHCRGKGACVDGICQCFLGFQGQDCGAQFCLANVNCPQMQICQDGLCTGWATTEQPLGPTHEPTSVPSKPQDDAHSPLPDPQPSQKVPVQEETVVQSAVQVITELGTSMNLFGTLARNSLLTALARAGAVNESAIGIVSMVEKPNTASLRRSPNPPQGSPPSPGTGDFTMENVLEVVSLILDTESSYSSLLAIQMTIESNWEDEVVAPMKSIGITVMSAQVSIVTLESAGSGDEDDVFKVFGKKIPFWLLSGGVFLIGLVATSILCCCFWRLRSSRSGVRQISANRQQKSKGRHSAYVFSVRPSRDLSQLEMGSKPSVAAPRQDLSDIKVSCQSYDLQDEKSTDSSFCSIIHSELK